MVTVHSYQYMTMTDDDDDELVVGSARRRRRRQQRCQREKWGGGKSDGDDDHVLVLLRSRCQRQIGQKCCSTRRRIQVQEEEEEEKTFVVQQSIVGLEQGGGGKLQKCQKNFVHKEHKMTMADAGGPWPWRGQYKMISSLALFCHFFLVTLFVDSVTCAPVRSSGFSSLQNYLLKFGYLPQSGFEIRDQVTEERMQQAIRDLQEFAKINVTGELDADTRRLLRKPRCGNPDVLAGQFRSRKKRFALQGQRWKTTNLTWSLKKGSNNPDTQRAAIEREMYYALEVWSKSTPLSFQRVEGARADEADIRIIFERGRHDDGYPFDGKGSILAHAFFPGSGTGGDAHFDDDEIWLVDSVRENREGTRLFSVAAHEFGHSLGLSHSDVEGALMYPWYQSFDYDLTLSRDDELGIQQIYGTKTSRGKVKNPYPPENRPLEPPTKTPHHRDHRPSRPTHHDGRPNTCDSSYDAISLIRDELFIFKGKYFWRINDNQLLKGYPTLIVNMWQALPQNLTHVDAVYERNDVEIIFFIGKLIYRFQGTDLVRGYPKPLTSLRISPNVEKMDGAMIWGHNGKTYLFSGSQYWRLDDTGPIWSVEPDYPRDMYVWRDVPYHIDSVLQWKNKKVYFFKGKVFWEFDDRHMRVTNKYPSLSAPVWMGCTSDPIPRGDDDGSTTASSSMSHLCGKLNFFSFHHLHLIIFLEFLKFIYNSFHISRIICY